MILQPHKGFTILELLVTFGIFFVIVTASMPIYNKLYTSSKINTAKAQLMQTLRVAREHSIAGLNNVNGNTTHGVHLEANSYTLFQDSTSPYTYATRDAGYDQVTTLNSSISLGPVGSDVVFTRGSGVVATPITITLTNTGGDTGAVSVNALGLVSSASSVSSFGGPILIIESTGNPFTTYYKEILLAEGLNMYDRKDILAVNAGMLADYDIAILGDIDLTDAQVTILTNWVNAGGRLIAMSPDVSGTGSLQSLLGLSGAACTALSNAYWNIDTTVLPGTGIVTSTIQFHGDADNCTLSGATEVATLYSNISTSLSKPAVTTRSVGGNGGQAAAFMFDLARSVVYTRQGNPALVGIECGGDGATLLRGNDLFCGTPSWLDFANIQIPQADEAQRLLANMILNMLANKRPIPRFGYLPRGEKAVVIMTGDDHGNGGTATRFNSYKTASVPGCVMLDWECIRSTSFIYSATIIAGEATFISDGFDISLHPQHASGCGLNFTTFDGDLSSQLTSFASNHPAPVPTPITGRTHCMGWFDYSSHPTIYSGRGIRMDTNYYYYPDGWVAERAGLFTGSGFPMKFADSSGNTINTYQATTYIHDEDNVMNPPAPHINTLLDNAIGTAGYFGMFTINAHTDFNTPGSAAIILSDAVIASAQARGVKIISARQALDWLDGKSASSFSCSTQSSCSVSWNPTARRLSFTLAYDTKARGLNTLVPFSFSGSSVGAVRQNANPLSFVTETIKGISYARFASTGGTYEVDYVSDTTPPTNPSTLTATPISGSQINLSWTASSDPESGIALYAIERCQGSACSPTVEITTVPGTQTTYSDSGLSASTFYNYRVRAKNGANLYSVAYSNTAEAQTTGTVSLWSPSAVPGTPAFTGDSSSVELGVRFTSDVAGFIRGIRFYKGTTNTGTHTGHLWTSTGTLLGTIIFSGETASGWQQMLFPSSIAISASTQYIASYHAPVGNYAIDSLYFATVGVDTPPLHAPVNTGPAPNGIFGAGGTFPNSTFNSSNYWVDVVFATTP